MFFVKGFVRAFCVVRGQGFFKRTCSIFPCSYNSNASVSILTLYIHTILYVLNL